MPARKSNIEEPTTGDLRELLALLRKQTPSSPDWYQVIDHCVGVLLADRLRQAEENQ